VTGTNLLPDARASAAKGINLAAASDFGQQAVATMGAVADLYGIRNASREFVSRGVQTSSTGYRHVRLNQMYQGLPVFGAQVMVHFDGKGAARSVNGVYQPMGQLDITPVLTGGQASDIARTDLNTIEDLIGQVTEGPTLVVYAYDADPTPAYQLTLTQQKDGHVVGRWRYWIDARSGAILLRYNDIPNASIVPPSGGGATAITGEVLDGEGGSVIGVNGWLAGGAYYLWNTTERWYIYNVGHGPLGGGPDSGTYAHRFVNNWADSDPAEMSAARAFEGIQNYYLSVHGRNSFDGAGGVTRANIHYGYDYVNAYWNGTDFTFGDGDGYTANSLCVVDVSAHEFQHGVTENSANLIYANESGALNESFSDIFGALAEFYTQPDGRTNYPRKVAGTADWLMGEDCWLGTTALRDMRNPANAATVGAFGRQPTRYKGTFWYTGDGDRGGVHYNSGVQNYFFYLLCEGGIGRNDNVIQFYVPGIGIAAGEKLAYLTLTHYMTPGTDYPAAREAWLAAAQETDESGVTTNALFPVMAAWAAVGIGSASLVIPDDPFVSAGELASAPYLPSNKIYTVVNPSTTNAIWTISSGGAPWLTITPGTLEVPGRSMSSFELAINQAEAVTLPEGTYVETVSITNNLGQGSTSREVVLRIGRNYMLMSTPYAWIDPVAGLHAPVNALAGVSAGYDLPFPVRLYDVVSSTLYITPFGMIGFNPEGMNSVINTDLPKPAVPNGIICPLWDDVDARRLPAKVYYKVMGEAPSRKVVVTWLDAPHYADLNAMFSFQAIIPEAASPNNNNDIIFQYKEVAEESAVVGSGQSATIGIEDAYGGLARKYSYNGEKWLANRTAIMFTQTPVPDVHAPVGSIRSLGGVGSTATFEVKFDEPVTNSLAISSLILTGTTVPGSLSLTVAGGGMRFLVTVDGISGVGCVRMSVASGAARDLAGNPNAAFGPALYVVPVESVNFFDDMEKGPALWTISTNVYETLTTKAWEWGMPDYAGGPAASYSGTNCWGTILTNDYPNGMNAWVMSVPIEVGASPVLDFKVWFALEYFDAPIDFGYVEVNGGSGWVNVTPGDDFSGFSGGWLSKSIQLDNTLFGHRTIQVRFRATSDAAGTYAGMYVDDVQVRSQRGPGIWVISYTPTHGNWGTNIPVRFVAYNANTATYTSVTGDVGSPDAGVSVTGVMPVVYGNLPPGTVSTGASPVQVVLGTAGNFQMPVIQLFHQALSGSLSISQESLPFVVDGIMAGAAATNTLFVQSTTGVTNWLGKYLSGDGGVASCLYQVIAAGSNLVIDPPTSSGQVTGDDELLYSVGLRQSWGRFGEGGVPTNFGRFKNTFNHGLAAGTKVYVRAWDGFSFAGAVAYGDSSLYVMQAGASQSKDFGRWGVGTPNNPGRDSNGDSISDGYAVLHGMDPRLPITPLPPSWSLAQVLGTRGSGPGQFIGVSPTRLFYKGSFLYVLDTGNNRIQIWNRYTAQYLASYGSQGTSDGKFNKPYGLALFPQTNVNRFAVADQVNHRIQVFEFDPLTGTNISHVLTFGGNDLVRPTDVTLTPDGRFYVTDVRVNGAAQDVSVVEVFAANGTYLSTLASSGTAAGLVNEPWGLGLGSMGMSMVADTRNDRIQAFDSLGTLLWTIGTRGTNASQFSLPSGVQGGLNGRVYVADTGNSRIQVLTKEGDFIATLGSHGANFEQVLNHPYGLMPVMESNLVYVADTYNNRVLAIAPIYDSDGDGMDDIWEEIHGLNSNDPSDAWGDYDQDGLLNIGEYRLNQDPGLPIRITAFNFNPQVLRWETVSIGGIYRIEFSCDSLRMASNSWIHGSVVTSPVVGSFAVTNMLTITNRVEYFRVKRIGP
jgi:thermolysin